MGEAERPPPLPRPQPHLVRVFLSSPGDVAEERELARRLLKDILPYDIFLGDCFTFRVVSWDDPDAPMPMPAGLTPQHAVNRFGPQPSECDIVVVVLWSRLGTHLDLSAFGETPGGGPYLSGTEWEFEDAWGAKPRPEILVYRRKETPRLEIDDPDWEEKRLQYERVGQFMTRFRNPDRSLRGGWTDYEGPVQFEERLASDLRRLLRERVEVTRVAAEKGVPVAPLRDVLVRLGEHEEVPEHEIPARLARWAEEFAAARERLERPANDPPEAEAARHRATALLEAGDLEEAQAVLAEARRKQREVTQNRREAWQQAAQEEAAILADEARVHRLRLDYAAAAEALQEAAGLVAGFDPAQAWRKAIHAGAALTDQGYEFGDNAALGRAIAVYRDTLALAPRSERPEDWAATQASLGIALRVLGHREAGTARLEEAVDAFRAALEVRTRERVPLQWAATQAGLGIALLALGGREAGTARLEEAADAFRAALEVRTRERVPLQWAETQVGLGEALRVLGCREVGTGRLEEAADAFRAALEARTREHVPLQWAETQGSLGEALRLLGCREAGTARLEEAEAAFRAALEVSTRERAPLEWAWTQHSLGEALRLLGRRKAGAARLEEAVDAFRAALEARTREHVPLDWAWTQISLAQAVAEIGTRMDNPARWQEALGRAEAALEVSEAAGAPHYAAKARKLRNAIRAKLMDGPRA